MAATCRQCKGRQGAHFHWCPTLAPKTPVPEVLPPPAPAPAVAPPVDSPDCSECKGHDYAHFHWCTVVGGKGSPAAQRRAIERAAEEEAARRHAEEVAAADALLRKAFHRVVPPTPEVEAWAKEQAIEAAKVRHPARGALVPPEVEQEHRERKASVCTACGQAGGRHATNCEPCPQCHLRGWHKQDCSRRGIMPRLKVVRAPEPAPEPAPRPTWRWSGTEPNWDEISGFELDATANDMRMACDRGLPAAVPYMIRDDVLALEGFDESAVERALREPDRVEIRPETAEKKYPVLGFRRGDVVVILGMRTPRNPAIIAAYWTSLLSGYDPKAHRDRTGGGGSKAASGLPTTPKAVIKRLKMMGAAVDLDPSSVSAATAEVRYDGQSLGKISIGEHVDRATVESDYQRMQRKIHAIDLRANSVKGHQS